MLLRLAFLVWNFIISNSFATKALRHKEKVYSWNYVKKRIANHQIPYWFGMNMYHFILGALVSLWLNKYHQNHQKGLACIALCLYRSCGSGLQPRLKSIAFLYSMFDVGRSMLDVRCSLVSFSDQTDRLSGQRLGWHLKLGPNTNLPLPFKPIVWQY